MRLNRILAGMLVILLALSLTGCGGSNVPDWADTATETELAEQVVDLFNAGDAEAISEMFKDEDVSVEAITKARETIDDMGAFVSYGDATISGGTKNNKDYVTVSLPAAYENGSKTYTISFYQDGSLAGFYVK